MYILVLLCILAVIAIPVMAANETQMDNGTRYYNYGVMSLDQGNYTDAILWFDKALASNTTMIRESDGLLYTYQGKSYAQFQLGQYKDALTTVDEGLAIYPNDTGLVNNRGYAFYKMGDYPDAVAAYDQALAIDSTLTGTWINKGDALNQTGDYQGAVAAYTEALNQSSGNPVATQKLAIAQKAAASAKSALTILIAIVVIVAAAGAVIYYIKREPVKEESVEKPVKEEKKKKK